MHYADEMLDERKPTTAWQFLIRAIAQDSDARTAEENGRMRQAQYLYILSRINLEIASRLEVGMCADDLERGIVLQAA